MIGDQHAAKRVFLDVRAIAIVDWSAVTNRTNLADVLELRARSKGFSVGHPESHDCQKRPPFIFY